MLLENTLGFPINPAEYIPDTEHTSALKKNLEQDMSIERDFIQRGVLLSDTRAALAEQVLEGQAPRHFTKAYQRAEAYKAQVLQALQAKRQAMLKGYQEEIKRLDKEVALLEKAKEKKELTVSDVLQIEQTIELKRIVVRGLHEKVTAGIAEEQELTEGQEAAPVIRPTVPPTPSPRAPFCHQSFTLLPPTTAHALFPSTHPTSASVFACAKLNAGKRRAERHKPGGLRQ